MNCCFINSEDPPIKTERISLFTRLEDIGEGPCVCLYEVIKETHRHPQAPDDAVVQLTTTRFIAKEKAASPRAANLMLLHHALEACNQFLAVIGK